MSEKLCLKWNDFKDNVNTTFGSLRGDVEFADVTLACEDGQQVEAHKVILSASSPFFKNILKRNKHTHPLIFMRGVKSEDLRAIVDFLYFGEADVFQENLDSFLAIADELQLKGLMGQTNENGDTKEDTNQTFNDTKPVLKNTKRSQPTVSRDVHFSEQTQNTSNVTTLALPNVSSSEYMHELDETVRSMMEKGESNGGPRKVYTCKVCGKKGQSIDMQQHIEANHMEGLSIPCNLCDKTARSRHALRNHMRSYHTDKV